MRNEGEQIAKDYLSNVMGWKFLASNYLRAGGEIDLIFWEAREDISNLHFIEVKSWRNTSGDFHPAYSLTQKKIERYKKTALSFVSEHSIYEKSNYQFDLLLVSPFDKGIKLYIAFFNS